MYSIFVTIDVKPEHVEEFTQASFGDARGSVRDEPGCFRFDINQDQEIPSRFYLYEVYRDEEAFQAHLEAPHFKEWDRHRQADVRRRAREGVDEHGVPLRLGVGAAETRACELVAIRCREVPPRKAAESRLGKRSFPVWKNAPWQPAAPPWG